MFAGSTVFSSSMLLPIVFLLLFSISSVHGEDKGKKPEVCEDDLENCSDFSLDTCTSYPSWAKSFCAKTCGICKQVTTECPKGWELYEADKTCIKGFGFTNNGLRKSWYGGRKQCKDFDGDLVIIRDEDKRKWILNRYGHVNAFFWIGLRNVAVNKTDFTFEYVDGTKLGDFHPWYPGNPDYHDKEEECVIHFPSGALGGTWDDYNCHIFDPFVCSINLG